jgi:hypothetical protein
MELLVGFAGIVIAFTVLLDAFETIILPRRVTQQFRLSRLFYRVTWALFSAVARRIGSVRRRDNFLALYGPLSLISLLIIWASTLILGFAMLHWALHSQISSPDADVTFFTYLYLSGSSFFTLGFGDVTPLGPWGRALAVVESGTGFAFLAFVIGYLPALNSAFSAREVHVSLLDERSGSPPTALELLRRHYQGDELAGIDLIMHDWERWTAELLESHLSYPVLGYFRSQHDNQSWVAALTMILDASALVLVGMNNSSTRQAQLTFAMARHTAVDLTQVLGTRPLVPDLQRVTHEDLELIRATLKAANIRLREGEEADNKLADLRKMYEPFVNALSQHLLMPLPPWIPPAGVPDSWQTSPWDGVARDEGRGTRDEGRGTSDVR